MCIPNKKAADFPARFWGPLSLCVLWIVNISDCICYLFRPALGVLVLPLLLNNSPAVSNSMSDSPNMTIF